MVVNSTMLLLCIVSWAVSYWVSFGYWRQRIDGTVDSTVREGGYTFVIMTSGKATGESLWVDSGVLQLSRDIDEVNPNKQNVRNLVLSGPTGWHSSVIAGQTSPNWGKGFFFWNLVRLEAPTAAQFDPLVDVGRQKAIIFRIKLWVPTLICMLTLSTQVAFIMKSRHRKRTGLCPQCSYDLRGNTSGICPECGLPIR